MGYENKPANDVIDPWMMWVKDFERLGIHPMEKVVEDETLFYYDYCRAREAEHWCVSGRFNNGGFKYIDIYDTKEEALKVAEKIRKMYPNLKKPVILGKPENPIKVALRKMVLCILKCLESEELG